MKEDPEKYWVEWNAGMEEAYKRREELDIELKKRGKKSNTSRRLNA